jgi:anti-sigma B factor antagonist
MKFTVDKRERYLIFQLLEDRLDTAIAPALKTEFVVLSNEGYRNMIIDLGQVSFVDSSGLGAILIGNRLCKNNKGTFVLTGVQEPVVKLIKISQLDEILNVVGSEEEANDFILMEEVQREIEGGNGQEE